MYNFRVRLKFLGTTSKDQCGCCPFLRSRNYQTGLAPGLLVVMCYKTRASIGIEIVNHSQALSFNPSCEGIFQSSILTVVFNDVFFLSLHHISFFSVSVFFQVLTCYCSPMHLHFP